MPNKGENAENSARTELESWEKPEIVSYTPASSAQGISYTPSDGISNLTP